MPSSGSVQSGVSYASSSSGRAPPPAQQPPHHPPQQQPPNPSHPQQPGQQGYPRPQQQAAPQGYMAPPPNPPRGGHSPAPGPTPFHAHAPQHPGAPPRYPSSAPSAVSYQSPTPGPGYAPPPQGHAHGPGQAGASSAHAYAQQYGAGASSGPGGQGYAPAQPGSRTSRDRPGQPAPANPEEELRQLYVSALSEALTTPQLTATRPRRRTASQIPTSPARASSPPRRCRRCFRRKHGRAAEEGEEEGEGAVQWAGSRLARTVSRWCVCRWGRAGHG